MILKIIFLFSLISSVSSAQTCTDSDEGLQKETAGKIIYSLSSSTCLSQECYQNFMRDSDYCSSNKTLIEFSCEKNLPQKTEITCPNSCYQGRCL